METQKEKNDELGEGSTQEGQRDGIEGKSKTRIGNEMESPTWFENDATSLTLTGPAGSFMILNSTHQHWNRPLWNFLVEVLTEACEIQFRKQDVALGIDRSWRR